MDLSKWNSRPLPKKINLEFDPDFKTCWSFCFKLNVLIKVKVLDALDLLGLWQCLGLFARVISSVCECNVHICFCICLWVWPEGLPPLGWLVGWLVSRWGTWLVNSHQLVVVALRPSRQCDRTLWSDWPRQRSGYMVQRNIRHSLDFRH